MKSYGNDMEEHAELEWSSVATSSLVDNVLGKVEEWDDQAGGESGLLFNNPSQLSIVMYRRYEENANDKNKNVEFWWETTKFEALFFSELHLKSTVLDFGSDDVPNYRDRQDRFLIKDLSSLLGAQELCQS